MNTKILVLYKKKKIYILIKRINVFTSTHIEVDLSG